MLVILRKWFYLRLHHSHSLKLFKRNYYNGLLEKSVLDCMCALSLWTNLTFAPLYLLTFSVKLVNLQYSFISIGASLWLIFGHCSIGVVSLPEPFPPPRLTFSWKCLYLGFTLTEVCNLQSTSRRSRAVNLLVMSGLTLDHSFKVKPWRWNIKVPVFHSWLVLEVSMFI